MRSYRYQGAFHAVIEARELAFYEEGRGNFLAALQRILESGARAGDIEVLMTSQRLTLDVLHRDLEEQIRRARLELAEAKKCGGDFDEEWAKYLKESLIGAEVIMNAIGPVVRGERAP